MNNELVMKPVEGFEGYSVTPDGKVWSHYDKKFMQFFLSNGYWCVKLWKNGKNHNKRINRLIAEAFVEKPDNWTPKMDVAHEDDNRLNNHYTNLKWKTRAENLDTDHFREAQKNKIYSEVRCVETGEVFPSIAAAGRAIGKHRYGINLCLLGKQKTCGGYHWERVREEV